jgi:hypothetical protein
MAIGAETTVLSAAMSAWREALAARERMPNLFWTAMAGIAILNIVYFALTVMTFEPGLVSLLIGLAYAIVHGLLLTPLAIAVHRFVLLNETMSAYKLDTRDPRFVRFFTFLAGLAVVMLIPRLIGDLFGPFLGGRLVSLILSIVAAIILVRNVILFPAVAVDAPGADWRNAMADTKGHSWRVFFILLCVTLPPAIVVSIVLMVLFAIPIVGWVIAVAVQAAFVALAVAAMAAAASRLYVDYANALGRPMGLAGQAAA